MVLCKIPFCLASIAFRLFQHLQLGTADYRVLSAIKSMQTQQVTGAHVDHVSLLCCAHLECTPGSAT